MFTLITAGLLLTTVVLMANSMKNKGFGSFASFDRNSDCSISSEEFNKNRTQQMNRMFQGANMMNGNYSHFADIDTNNDNSISEEEFNIHQESMSERMNQMHSFMSQRGHGMGRF